jgi:hypothetical protein
MEFNNSNLGCHKIVDVGLVINHTHLRIGDGYRNRVVHRYCIYKYALINL